MANSVNKGLYLPDKADTTVEVPVSLKNNFVIIDTELKNNEDALITHKAAANAHTSENISHTDGSVKAALDAVNTNIAILSEEQDVQATELADHASQLAQKTPVYDVKKYGAKGDGTTDDTQAIKDAIADMTNNSILYFRTGIYKFTDDLTIDGLLNITIKGDGAGTTRLLNASSNKTVVFLNSSYIDILNIGIIGNGSPPNGTGATGGNGLTFMNSSHVMMNGVDVSFHGGNGIHLVSDCWVFNFTNVRIIGNQKNGFLGLTQATLQATAIYFTNCVIWFNKLTGLWWCGVSLSVTNSVIEQNQRGIWIDCTNSVSPATNVYITGNDFEINEYEQIKITPFGEISGLVIKIDSNNFVNTQVNQGKSTGLVVIDNTGNNVIGFELGINNYTITDYHNAFNGNNKLYSDCKISLSKLVPVEKFLNLGQAKITGLSNSRAISGMFEQNGIPFYDPSSSNNLMPLDSIVGYWKLPIHEWGFIESIDLNFYTDTTNNYSVQFDLYRHTPAGAFVAYANGSVTKTGGGSGKVTFNLGMGLDISLHSSLILKTTITKPATAGVFAITNLVVNGSF